jgi:hypothetical protein
MTKEGPTTGSPSVEEVRWTRAGTRALGINPRALGTNPRAKARHKWALRNWKRGKRKQK